MWLAPDLTECTCCVSLGFSISLCEGKAGKALEPSNKPTFFQVLRVWGSIVEKIILTFFFILRFVTLQSSATGYCRWRHISEDSKLITVHYWYTAGVNTGCLLVTTLSPSDPTSLNTSIWISWPNSFITEYEEGWDEWRNEDASNEAWRHPYLVTERQVIIHRTWNDSRPMSNCLISAGLKTYCILATMFPYFRTTTQLCTRRPYYILT